MARKKSGEPAATNPAATPKAAGIQRRPRRVSARSSGESVVTRRTQPHNESQIRERAYYIYLKRQGDAGDAVSDWLQAERELSG